MARSGSNRLQPYHYVLISLLAEAEHHDQVYYVDIAINQYLIQNAKRFSQSNITADNILEEFEKQGVPIDKVPKDIVDAFKLVRRSQKRQSS